MKTASYNLILICFIWGLGFPLIKIGLNQLDALSFIVHRFAVASICFALVLLVRKQSWQSLKSSFKHGIVLGSISYITYHSQSIGLESIPSARSAFLTSLFVIFVPLMNPVFSKKSILKKEYIAIILACLGMLLLTQPHISPLVAGDYWTILCAFSVGIYIHLLEIFSKQKQHDVYALSFWQIIAVFVLALAFSNPILNPNFSLQWPEFTWNLQGLSTIAILFYCGFLSTVITFLLQTKYQKFVSPQKASLIFSLEPVFAAIFAYFILNESMNYISLLGATLILLASIIL